MICIYYPLMLKWQVRRAGPLSGICPGAMSMYNVGLRMEGRGIVNGMYLIFLLVRCPLNLPVPSGKYIAYSWYILAHHDSAFCVGDILSCRSHGVVRSVGNTFVVCAAGIADKLLKCLRGAPPISEALRQFSSRDFEISPSTRSSFGDCAVIITATRRSTQRADIFRSSATWIENVSPTQNASTQKSWYAVLYWGLWLPSPTILVY
jgi:hypothetical protein